MTHVVLSKPLMAAALIVGALAGPAQAQDFGLEELRAGVFYHSAYGGFLPTGPNWDLSRLEDVKFAALFASPDIAAFEWIGSPRPEIGATLSLAGRERDAHVVPEDAVLTRGREHSVFVVEDGRAVRRVVKLGIRVPGAVEVVDGLTGTEQVVTHGAIRLEDGAAVQVRAVDDGSRSLAELLEATAGAKR